MLDSARGSIRRSVSIDAGETARVEETIFAGWLAVLAPFEVTIREGGHVVPRDDRDQALLPSGPHDITLDNPALEFHEARHVDVRPGEVARVVVAAPRSRLTINATAPADVWLDDMPIGATPLVDIPVDIGTRELRLKSAAAERRVTVTVTTKPLALNVDFAGQ